MASEKEIVFRIKVLGTEEQTKAIVDARREVTSYESELKKLKKSTDGNVAAQKAAAERFVLLETRLKAAKNNYADLQANVQESNDGLRKNSGLVNGVTEAINNSVVGIQAQIARLKEQSGTLDISSKAFKDNQGEIQDLTNQLGVATGRFDEFGERTKKGSAETADNFADV